MTQSTLTNHRIISFPKRKMKFVLFSSVCVGIFYVAAGSILPASQYDSKHPLNSVQESADDVVEDKADLKTLQLVQVIFRHGDRTPIDRFPKDPYDSRTYWPEGWGRLTNVGKQMQYKLGQYIRKRYDGYLNKTYTAEEIYVQSSDKDRTIMSAMANLAGMWPSLNDEKLGYGGEQQFVPVHSIAPNLDNKIAFTRPCPKYTKELTEVHKTPSEVKFNSEQESLYKYLSDHTGLKVTSYFNVSDIYDTLFVQTRHNLTLPDWTKSVFPEKMLPSAERWIKANTFTETMRKLKAGPILTELALNMKQATAQYGQKLSEIPTAKLYAYSGHDTTLSAVLEALSLYNGRIPPYASSLYFELHRQKDGGDYFVKIYYRTNLNGVAEEIKMKDCGSDLCSFEKFIKNIDQYMMDDKEWEKMCAL